MQTLWPAIELEFFVHPTLFHIREVLFQFDKPDIPASREDINPAIIIEKERCIMICRQSAVEFPSFSR